MWKKLGANFPLKSLDMERTCAETQPQKMCQETVMNRSLPKKSKKRKCQNRSEAFWAVLNRSKRFRTVPKTKPFWTVLWGVTFSPQNRSEPFSVLQSRVSFLLYIYIFFFWVNLYSIVGYRTFATFVCGCFLWPGRLTKDLGKSLLISNMSLLHSFGLRAPPIAYGHPTKIQAVAWNKWKSFNCSTNGEEKKTKTRNNSKNRGKCNFVTFHVFHFVYHFFATFVDLHPNSWKWEEKKNDDKQRQNNGKKKWYPKFKGRKMIEKTWKNGKTNDNQNLNDNKNGKKLMKWMFQPSLRYGCKIFSRLPQKNLDTRHVSGGHWLAETLGMGTHKCEVSDGMFANRRSFVSKLWHCVRRVSIY